METTLGGFAVFAFCLTGCSVTCWHLGKTVGIKGTVTYLIEKGLLEVDEEVPR